MIIDRSDVCFLQNTDFHVYGYKIIKRDFSLPVLRDREGGQLIPESVWKSKHQSRLYLPEFYLYMHIICEGCCYELNVRKRTCYYGKIIEATFKNFLSEIKVQFR